METHFQQELNHLKSEILKMAGLVERAISNAIESLTQRDTPLAEKTIQQDVQINGMEIDIDERCLNLLALHQPMAGDLRFIASTMRINTELERIGDLAVNIAERVVSLNQEPQLKPYIDIPNMADITKKMLRDVIDAFVSGDVALARSVCERDDQVDGLNNQVFRELLTYMMEDPKTITRAVHLIIVSRYLERIADHATNIAEGVIFMAEALVIKHHADVKGRNEKESNPLEQKPGSA
jgi:phosphate transport system protein